MSRGLARKDDAVKSGNFIRKIRDWVGKRSSFELTTIFVFVTTTLSAMVVFIVVATRLEFYEINIQDVPGVISLTDYVLTLLPVAFSVMAIVPIYLLLNRLSERSASRLLKAILNVKKPHSAIRSFLQKVRNNERIQKYLTRMYVNFNAFVVIFLFFFIIFWVVPSVYYGTAKKRVLYSSISDPSDDIQLLVIRNMGDQILVKPYSKSENKFQDGFEIKPSATKYRNFKVMNTN